MRTVISCVVDGHPKFLMQAWNLVCSLMETGDWPKAGVDLIIHHTTSVDASKLAMFAGLGAKLVQVEPWGSGKAAYCNKLRQLETPEVTNADVAILFDTDVVVARPLGALASSTKVRGKIVDYPNPPEEMWRDMLAGTAFEGRDFFEGRPSMRADARTPETNFNGGVYVLPREAMAVLKSFWPKWSNICLERGDRLGKYEHHADQMGFALAMLDVGLDYELLSIGENFPLHFGADAYRAVEPCDISIIHYHWHVENHGLPKLVGVEWIDEQVQSVSKRIAARRKQVFDNVIFRDDRLDAGPELEPLTQVPTEADQVLGGDRETVEIEGAHGRFRAFPNDLITSQIIEFGAHTRNEIAMLLDHLPPGATCVDLGAHIGTFTIPMARKAGPMGRVLSVEGSGATKRLLDHNIAMNGLTDRVITFEAIAGDGSSLHIGRNEVAGNSGAGYFAPAKEAALTATANMADLLVANGFGRPQLIKIDVEGMEGIVLRNLASIIEQHRPVLYIEIASEQLARFGDSPAGIEAQLRASGYRFFRNTGQRNSSNDSYMMSELDTLVSDLPLFDLLALQAA